MENDSLTQLYDFLESVITTQTCGSNRQGGIHELSFEEIFPMAKKYLLTEIAVERYISLISLRSCLARIDQELR
jgi:hypothetical protein